MTHAAKNKMAGLAILAGIMLFTAAAMLWAQAPVGPGNKLTWDMTGNITLSEAQSAIYTLIDNGKPTTQPLLPISCAGSTPIVCSTPLPQLAGGSHTLSITAVVTIGSTSFTTGPSNQITANVIVINIGNLRLQ
jgi:hypothetical protein